MHIKQCKTHMTNHQKMLALTSTTTFFHRRSKECHPGTRSVCPGKYFIFHPLNLSWKYLVNTYMTIRVSPTSFVLIVYLIWQNFFLFRPKYHGCIIFLCDGLFAVLPLDQTVICGIFARAFTIACCGLCRIQVALRDLMGWIWMQMQV